VSQVGWDAVQQLVSLNLVRGDQLTGLLHEPGDLRLVGGVNSFSAKEVGHMVPSSRFAASLKPNVAYRVLNFSAALEEADDTFLTPVPLACRFSISLGRYMLQDRSSRAVACQIGVLRCLLRLVVYGFRGS
jgi:hypothetical protein